ncbi:hypothetical protein [Glycomyces terrestris]|uniref:Rpn family recombination-promoting nuclease/putative transposase n=1 Tax=Glycomyces terrestris TaxID=2493553 RepID=A0A426UW62_9ACTN|nr:hypothetical protein [Glycomyces terrestris]RRR98575.1 hypothetical protein EIW28_17040 [Glycomyces terrestris]
MPGEFHEILVKLIQDEPESVAWLLGRAGGRRGARCVAAQTRTGSVGSPGPTERRADGVVRLEFADGSQLLVVCEVQNEWSEDKYFRLPGYVSRAFEDHRIPVSLLMICRSDSLARRFRRGIEMGPGSTVAVETVGPSQVPELGSGDEPPTAAAAVLAAVLRKQPKHVPEPLFVSTLDAWLGTIEPGRAADYAKYLLTTLAKEPATLLEALMKTEARLYHSEYTEELLAKGREKGLEEGLEEGALRHARATLLRILEAGGPVSAERREAIESCTDLARLDAWITEQIPSAQG